MRRITIVLLALTALAWAGYDIWAFDHPSPENSISEIIRSTVLHWSVLPFCIGTVFGHWLWPALTERRPIFRFLGAYALVLILIVLFFIENTGIHPTTMAILGFFIGRALWPLYVEPKRNKPR